MKYLTLCLILNSHGYILGVKVTPHQPLQGCEQLKDSIERLGYTGQVNNVVSDWSARMNNPVPVTAQEKTVKIAGSTRFKTEYTFSA